MPRVVAAVRPRLEAAAVAGVVVRPRPGVSAVRAAVLLAGAAGPVARAAGPEVWVLRSCPALAPRAARQRPGPVPAGRGDRGRRRWSSQTYRRGAGDSASARPGPPPALRP